MLAGTGSGLTEGVFITPFEKVKVSLQAQKSHASIVSNCCLVKFIEYYNLLIAVSKHLVTCSLYC